MGGHFCKVEILCKSNQGDNQVHENYEEIWRMTTFFASVIRIVNFELPNEPVHSPRFKMYLRVHHSSEYRRVFVW